MNKTIIKAFSRYFILFFFALVFLHGYGLASEEDITKGKRRVAVYPFEINSPEKKDAFLSSAFPETLTSALSQVNALILLERGELKKLLDEQKLGQTGIIDPETAVKTGKILGAETAVLGSFNRIGNKVRASCRLVNVETGEVDKTHIIKVYLELSKEEDLFDLMEELSNNLIKSFDVNVTPEESKQISFRADPTKNYSAYEYYIEGREKMLLFDIEGYERAVSLFKKAIEADPKYALAYAALSETYHYGGIYKKEAGTEFQTYYDLCYENAKKAVKLRPDLSEPHRAMALAYIIDFAKKQNDKIRKQEAQKAVDLNPNDSESYYILWMAYGFDPDDPRIKRAIALNPRFSAAYADLGLSLYLRGRYDEAISNWKKGLEINPRNFVLLINLGAAFEKKGFYDEALLSYKKALEINPHHSSAYGNIGGALGKKGLYDEAILNLRKALEINPRNSDAYNSMGDVLYKKGNIKDASDSWSKSCELGYKPGCDNLKKFAQ